MSYKGFFKPRNPTKYRGDCTNIVYRSRWELKFMAYLDGHKDVVEWASEEFSIPYLSPIDGKVHRYFPDFLVKKRNARGEGETLLIEIKPAAQTKPPAIPARKTKQFINEVKTWGVNSAKWKAAEEFCKDRSWKFVIMTEKELGIKF